jgi:hypothetical protein
LLFEIDAEVLHDDPGLIRTSLIFTKSFLTDWSIGQENLTSQREFSGFSGKKLECWMEHGRSIPGVGMDIE